MEHKGFKYDVKAMVDGSTPEEKLKLLRAAMRRGNEEGRIEYDRQLNTERVIEILNMQLRAVLDAYDAHRGNGE
jgi:hypothetical protein